MEKETSCEFCDIAPTFVVTNMRDALAFYEGILGFHSIFRDGDPPVYVVLKRDAAHIHLFPKHLERQQPGFSNCYITVTDVDSLYRDLRELGVRVAHELKAQVYGMKDFVIEDPDGNHIGFGQRI